MIAIAAAARNRVIGQGDAIPWRLPDELRFFRRTTLGGVVVMGRRTCESLPRPLDGRLTVVLTRVPARLVADPAFQARFGPALAPGGAAALAQARVPPTGEAQVRVVDGLEPLLAQGFAHPVWLCGGAQLYAAFLPRCSELLLSVLHREAEGDVRFPPFEHLFDLAGIVAEFPDFQVRRYVRNAAPASMPPAQGTPAAL